MRERDRAVRLVDRLERLMLRGRPGDPRDGAKWDKAYDAVDRFLKRRLSNTHMSGRLYRDG